MVQSAANCGRLSNIGQSACSFGVDRRSAGQPGDSRDRRLCLEPQVGTYRRLFEARRVSCFPSESFRRDLVGGVVSSAVAIPLAIGFGMFAFVSLGDQYFAEARSRV
jgi:hypothetical protein